MPGRTIGRGLQQIAGQVADIHGQQLQQLQQTQQLQSTLALQRTLRELDQTFIQKLNNQLSLADADKPITEDWLNEDFRQQELRRMFDERMQSIRGSVSTPAGQIDFESRAEAMWQQYEHNWRDKATAALRAWDQAALPKVLQGIIDESDLAEVDFAEAQILGVFERAVRSGTIPAEKRRAAQEAAVTQLYDTLLKGYIQDPREEGEEAENFVQGYDWSTNKIDEMYEKGRINRAHRDELRSFADAVLEARQQETAHAILQDSRDWLQHSVLDFRRKHPGADVDIQWSDVKDYVTDSEEYGLLPEVMRQQILDKMDQQRRAHNYRHRYGRAPADPEDDIIATIIVDSMQRVRDNGLDAEVLHLSELLESGDLLPYRDEVGDAGLIKVLEAVKTRLSELHGLQTDPFTALTDPNNQARRLFNNILDERDIPRDSLYAAHLRQSYGDHLGLGTREVHPSNKWPELTAEFIDMLNQETFSSALERRGIGGWIQGLLQGDVSFSQDQALTLLSHLHAGEMEIGLASEIMETLTRRTLGAMDAHPENKLTLKDFVATAEFVFGTKVDGLTDEGRNVFNNIVGAAKTLYRVYHHIGPSLATAEHELLPEAPDDGEYYLTAFDWNKGFRAPEFSVAYERNGKEIERTFRVESFVDDSGRQETRITFLGDLEARGRETILTTTLEELLGPEPSPVPTPRPDIDTEPPPEGGGPTPRVDPRRPPPLTPEPPQPDVPLAQQAFPDRSPQAAQEQADRMGLSDEELEQMIGMTAEQRAGFLRARRTRR